MEKLIWFKNHAGNETLVNMDAVQDVELLHDPKDRSKTQLHFRFGNERTVTVHSGEEALRVWRVLLERLEQWQRVHSSVGAQPKTPIARTAHGAHF